uniref:protein PFC0760c-like isoform X2 n=1 Tax=Erigeron canadensis TaxID=72917 RepID=UPI001CB99148|nr:protein PFC0760c-like isoform X2 [Erigeron canadensis]
MASFPPPSFFSLILDKSATNLKISTEFVTKHLKNKIPKGPIIICADGGYSWSLEIKKIGEDYYFDNGWTNVVKDTNFMFGDFVLFTLVDDICKFEMFVYDKNSCERSLPTKVKVEDNSVDNIAANVDVVNDDNVVDDDDDDDDDDVVDMDGDDPFFISTISKAHRTKLRLPDEFVESAGIEDERSIMLKNLDGEEWRMGLRPGKVNQSKKLYISSGWADFQQSNDLKEGDECVLKFIRSKGKILLAKVTKKKRPTRQLQASGESSKTKVVKKKRGRELHAHGRDLDVESEDEYIEPVKKRFRGNDDDDKDDDSDEDEYGEGDSDYDGDGNEVEEDNVEEEDGVDIDGHPFFTSTLSISYRSKLWFPANFVRLARIEAARTITLKNLDGEESSMRLHRMEKDSQIRYYSSWGWPGFQRRNKLREGDKCLFKYITSEGKICLAKVTKKQRPTRQLQASGESSKTKVVKKKRGRELHAHGIDVDVESEDEYMEPVKRLRGNDDDDKDEDSDEDEDGEGDNDYDDDGNEGEEDNVEEEDGVDIDGHPFFTSTISISYRSKLWFPANFVRLARIEAARTITLKNLDGQEMSMRLLRMEKDSQVRYYSSWGSPGFQRRNKLLEGDKCLFKYITSEGKICLTKVTKKQRPAHQPQLSAEIVGTKYVKRTRGREDGGDMDVESDECMEVMKRPRHEDEDDDDGDPFFIVTIREVKYLAGP